MITRFENSIGSGLVFQSANVAPEVVYICVKDRKAFLELVDPKRKGLERVDQLDRVGNVKAV